MSNKEIFINNHDDTLFTFSEACTLAYKHRRLCPGKARKEGDNGLLITLVPKVLYKRFLIRWLNNFGDLNFDWLIH